MLKQTIRQTQIGKQTATHKNNFIGNKSIVVSGVIDHENAMDFFYSSIDPRFSL